RRVPPARRGQFAPSGGSRLIARRGTPAAPIVAGFLNWQDNSLASLNQHINDLDWVVCDWGFLAPDGDSVQFVINRKVFDIVRKPGVGSPPAILLMVSNFDRRAPGTSPTAKRFDAEALRAFLR